jgi:uncharacterized membrane protein HdeD (DUF308 family)
LGVRRLETTAVEEEEDMERVKTFQEMLKEGSVTATEGLIATGVALVVIGILAIAAPLASGLLFNLIVGALLIGAGIVEMIDAFRAGTWQRGLLTGLAGLVALAAGVLYIARPVVGLVVLTFVFIAYLVFAGAFAIVTGFQLPRGTPGKGWAFVSGIVSLVLAYMAAVRMPDISGWLIGTFIGVSLIFAGISRLSLARGFRKAADVMHAPPAPQRA